MDYFFLIPIALLLGCIGLAAFLWSLKNGQYDDLSGAAERILFDGSHKADSKPLSDSILHSSSSLAGGSTTDRKNPNSSFSMLKPSYPSSSKTL